MNNLAVPSNFSVKPVTVDINPYGPVTIRPATNERLDVAAPSGLRIENALYNFHGSMLRREDGWFFYADSAKLQGLSPKARAVVLSELTTQINEYMDANPTIMNSLQVVAWHRQLAVLDDRIRHSERLIEGIEREATLILEQARQRAENNQKDLATEQQKLQTFREEREQHLKQAPKELGPVGVDVSEE